MGIRLYVRVKMNKKLTDEEIVKSLENCNRGYDDIRRHSCDTCPYREIEPCGKAQMTDCLNLIRRQKAESEQFERNMKNVLEIEKKNAVKEFAEKLKAIISEKGTLVRDYTGDKLVLRYEIDVNEVNAEIDKLLKEYKNDFSKS